MFGLILGTVIVLLALMSPLFKKKPMKLFIIRGIPGSGKSTLAEQMATSLNITYTETDQFMTEPDGTYLWSEDRLARAIDLSYDAIYLKIKKEEPVVITAGVYSRWRAMRDYVELAQTNGYDVYIIECTGDYGSIHGVTPERMERFRQRFIPNSGLPKMQGIVYSTYP